VLPVSEWILSWTAGGWIALGVFVAIIVLPSIRVIGPTEVGLVIKRFSVHKLPKDNPIAFHGEAGYQADLLMPGWRWKLWLVYKVEHFPWVQVPAGQVGVVIAQVGAPLPIGAKSAAYKPEFGNYSDMRAFVLGGGEKGVQRPVLPPGTLAPIHPVAFLVITEYQVCGVSVSPDLRAEQARRGRLTPEAFGLKPERLRVFRVEPEQRADGVIVDRVGIVTVYEGLPLPPGDIAGRLGGFNDVAEMVGRNAPDAELVEALLGSKNNLHNNYQDFQAFLDNGGRIGLQHDPLLYGAYCLNPFLVDVELVPMLVVEQGQVAVIKAYVGLPTEDISGSGFKYGMLVKPGRRGIWSEALRTGKYPINPHCYQWEIVQTYILTLNWADATSKAHHLDASLQPIQAKSREGFVFMIDLQVQIHVADTEAPRVICAVGTMQNLVSEVLQAAVGNHFRDRLQSMPAVRFIETRQQVQEEAFQHISKQLAIYEVETMGVYIQDVVFPDALVTVLTDREIANQEIETFQREKSAQDQRIQMEQAKGTADMQASLAKAQVGVDIAENQARARKAEASGEATFISETGTAKGAEVRAVGLARAEAYQAQVAAIGQIPTALVNVATALADKGIKIMPEILVAGGGGSGGLDGVAAALMRYLSGGLATADVPGEQAGPEPMQPPGKGGSTQ
jgi:regulator of protease activity HflC (stomatin/prohibitin superfamily)